MITINCPTHGTRMLLTASRIRGLVNTDRGIALAVQCWCGHHAMIHTGRQRGAPSADEGPPPAAPLRHAARARRLVAA